MDPMCVGIEHSDQFRAGLASQVLGADGREAGATAGWYRPQLLTLQHCLSFHCRALTPSFLYQLEAFPSPLWNQEGDQP